MAEINTNQTLQNKLKAKNPSLKLPKVTIYDVDSHFPKELLRDTICHQNDLDKDKMKALFNIKSKAKGEVIAADLNAKNQVWGGTTEDERGSLLMEFALSFGLAIENNEDSPPTFDGSMGRSLIQPKTYSNGEWTLNQRAATATALALLHGYGRNILIAVNKSDITLRSTTEETVIELLNFYFPEDQGLDSISQAKIRQVSRTPLSPDGPQGHIFLRCDGIHDPEVP
ncbi:hypothetical protein AVEN_125807-1 [Araneus ventricosus]|uniref:Endonuclease/exonuclease/phosphatase domain-containing protein n=1 Tax=Araneus ventricosus TaxID=182803 RepID=A0A4Y2RUS1_ARAVE|nr:hypothetical protein AVEN_125807-1 [Araneus ventricosus]